MGMARDFPTWLDMGLLHDLLRHCKLDSIVWLLLVGIDGSTIDKSHWNDLHLQFSHIDIRIVLCE